jgi:hypothetical protein
MIVQSSSIIYSFKSPLKDHKTWYSEINLVYKTMCVCVCGGGGACSSVVVKEVCYKPEGRRFKALPAALGPGVHSASNRNEYQKQKNNVSGE